MSLIIQDPCGLALMSMHSRISSILYRLSSVGEAVHHSTCPEFWVGSLVMSESKFAAGVRGKSSSEVN